MEVVFAYFSFSTNNFKIPAHIYLNFQDPKTRVFGDFGVWALNPILKNEDQNFNFTTI